MDVHTRRLLPFLVWLHVSGVSGSSFITTVDYGLTALATNITNTADCMCECNAFVAMFNMTHEQLEIEIKRIYSRLLLNKENISATVRKRISVPDSRPSAQSIGYVGILVLVASLGSIVVLDFTTLMRDVKVAVVNLRKFMTRDDVSDTTYHSVASGSGANRPEEKHVRLSKY
ncbi:uncharacterized protein [Haliotis cracherodii]|uniref:uncharacterized protein n=1 Tax=Haliotis cracherodii TaxID=6455 RepID=UPI0039ED2D81